MKVNDIVKFRIPEVWEEVDQRFKVLEDREDRVLVESINLNWEIKPTFVYFKSDLELVYN